MLTSPRPGSESGLHIGTVPSEPTACGSYHSFLESWVSSDGFVFIIVICDHLERYAIFNINI